MLIKNISIENFQCYDRVDNLPFSKGLNLIVGRGGKGKSKLFNAFYWVLFGKIYVTNCGWLITDNLPKTVIPEVKRHDFFNMRTLSKLSKGESATAAVILEVENEMGETYVIERSATAKRKTDGPLESSSTWEVSPNELKVTFDTEHGSQVKRGEMAYDVICQDLFPEGIRDYIWFQGETIDTLIDFRKADTLEKAVQKISYYPYFVRLSTILSTSLPKIAREENKKTKLASNNDSNITRLTNLASSLVLRISREEEKLKKAEENIALIEDRLSKDDVKLSGIATYASLVQKYNECELQITKVNNEMSKSDAQQRKQLPQFWIMRGIDELIDKAEMIINAFSEEELKVPSEMKYIDNPSRQKLEEILRTGKCFVCGSSTCDGTDAREYILRRIQEQEKYFQELEDYKNNLNQTKKFSLFIGKIQEYPSDVRRHLKNIDSQYKITQTDIHDLKLKRQRFKTQKDEYDEQIDVIKKTHGVDPVREAGTAQTLQSNIRATRSNLEREKRNYEMAKNELEDLKQQQKSVEEELGEAMKQGKIYVPETQWRLVTEFLSEICHRVQDKAKKELRNNIQAKANEYYRAFTAHDNGYKGSIKISENYQIEFEPGLNTSHEQRKKMSIINAILALNQEVLDVHYPFISDAPTSDFDRETSFNYLLGVKEVFKQSIIMTKDVDIDSDFYNMLERDSKVSRIYELVSDVTSPNDDPKIYEVSTVINPLK